MKSIFTNFRVLRNQYLVFFATVIFTIVITQVIIQYDLKEQNEDAKLINIAGRQRMLSQRISKLVLYIQLDVSDNNLQQSRLDTLGALVQRIESVHKSLRSGSEDFGLSDRRSPELEKLLNDASPGLSYIIDACKALITEPNPQNASFAVSIIAQHELNFLNIMEKTVSQYQLEAEQKLDKLKLIEFILSGISILIIALEFVFIFMPMIRRLKSANSDLTKINNELAATNEELVTTEEELRSNLEYVTALQEELKTREEQFRSAVENANDMIYDLDAQGKFFYVNPLMESSSEFSADELKQKYYHELIHFEHKDRVLEFYKTQRKKREEVSYLEFPMITKNGFEVWVGQNVKMFFRDDRVIKVSVIARDITVLRKAQEALRNSEIRFRSLTENSPVGIYQLDEAGKATYINKKWFDISGVSPEATYEERIAAIYDEDRQRVIASWSDAIERQQPITIQFRYNASNRDIKWVSNNLVPYYDVNDNFCGFIGTMSDITELRRAQEKIEESEKLYRLLSTNTKDVISLFKISDRPERTFISESCREVLGYEPNELMGSKYLELVAEEDRHQLTDIVQNKTLQGQSANIEYRIRHKDGRIIWLESISHPYFDESGKMLGFQTSARDITERKKMEIALRESVERFKTLATKAPVGIFQTDIKGNAIYMNERWGEIAGISINEAMGEGWASMIYEEDAPAVFDSWRKALSGKEDFDKIFRFKNPTGLRWVHTHATALYDGENRIAGYIGTIHDITQSKQAELILREAKERAEEATRAKSQFLSMMSHEIRTPMNAIIGLTNLLMEEHPRPDQLESLKLLKFSGDNLLTIINDILDFSKIEAGKITLENIDFDLHLLLNNIQQMLQQRAQEKGLSVFVKYDVALPDVFVGDPVRIGQIITNLLGNAIKFTEQGFVEVIVKREQIDGEEYYIRIQVRDTGIGIPEEKIKAIFESFSQASTETTRKFGGTGLGLSITKRLLNLMGSDIAVQSTLGKGSIFSFDLRLKKGQLKTAKATQQYKTFTDENIRVLLVEDNRVNQVVASNFLKKWGVNVDFANNGKEAVDMIQRSKYQIVLMDLQMPEMDGYEATQRIRAIDSDPYYKKVPILALTASAMMDIKAKVLEVGMTDFISKPFQPEELKEKLGRYVLKEPSVNHLASGSQVNLDLYTEGDVAFKRELAALLINNITELQQSFHRCLASKDGEEFRRVTHKVKSTLGMLGDHEFIELIEDIKKSLSENASINALQIKTFDIFHKKLIDGLKEEIKTS